MIVTDELLVCSITRTPLTVLTRVACHVTMAVTNVSGASNGKWHRFGSSRQSFVACFFVSLSILQPAKLARLRGRQSVRLHTLVGVVATGCTNALRTRLCLINRCHSPTHSVASAVHHHASQYSSYYSTPTCVHPLPSHCCLLLPACPHTSHRCCDLPPHSADCRADECGGGCAALFQKSAGDVCRSS